MFRSAIWRAKTESTLHLDVSVFVCVKGKKERERSYRRKQEIMFLSGGEIIFFS